MLETEGDCYWDEKTQRLVGSRISKIRQFLKKDLIKRTPTKPFNFVVYPDIEGGRHTKHFVDMQIFNCTCQHYNMRGEECSHILAVRLALQQEIDGGRMIPYEI